MSNKDSELYKRMCEPNTYKTTLMKVGVINKNRTVINKDALKEIIKHDTEKRNNKWFYNRSV